MENNRIGQEEFQSALGNVRAELYIVHDEFRHDRISRDAYVKRVRALRQLGQRFQQEFRHNIMAVSTRGKA